MTKAAGINVGKANLHVSASGGPVVRFDNAATDITKLLKHLHNPDTVPVVCGPTDGYERRLPSRPRPPETAVRVHHPGRARAFAETCGYEAKANPLDAQMLARYSEAFPEAYPWEPVTALHRQDMKEPLRRWPQFIDQRVQEKGRLDGGVSATIARSTQSHIAWLEKELARLAQEYQAVVKDNPILAEPVDLYPTVPRVGPLTTATLAAHLAELGLSHSKALTSLVELAPWFQDSGKRQGDRAAKGGRGLVRRAFYMWAWAVARHDGEIRRFYDRLRQRGKPSNVAVVPMMRQSLLQLNTVAPRGLPGHSRTAAGRLISPCDGLTSNTHARRIGMLLADQSHRVVPPVDRPRRQSIRTSDRDRSAFPGARCCSREYAGQKVTLGRLTRRRPRLVILKRYDGNHW